jgi:hypothetical protein
MSRQGLVELLHIDARQTMAKNIVRSAMVDRITEREFVAYLASLDAVRAAAAIRRRSACADRGKAHQPARRIGHTSATYRERGVEAEPRAQPPRETPFGLLSAARP